jgi:hypothetical protein
MQAELPERKPEAERAPAEAEAEPARRSRCTSRVASRAASRRNSADATVGAELAARAASAAAGAPAASEAAPPGSGTAEVVIDVRTEQPPTSARRPAHAPSAVVRDASPSSDPGGSATPPERSADADLVPAYTQWPSKSRFYLSGRLMTGPSADDRLRLGTWAALLGPFVAFFVAAGAGATSRRPRVSPIPRLAFRVTWSCLGVLPCGRACSSSPCPSLRALVRLAACGVVALDAFSVRVSALFVPLVCPEGTLVSPSFSRVPSRSVLTRTAQSRALRCDQPSRSRACGLRGRVCGSHANGGVTTPLDLIEYSN